MNGFYEVYLATGYGQERVATFKDVANVRGYIEANRPNLDEVTHLTIHGKSTPIVGPFPSLYNEYVPINAENAHNYTIATKKHYGMLQVVYTKFDD